MVLNNVKGFDGPYEAPLKLPIRKVLKSWIDYNGHMNVAYYTMAVSYTHLTLPTTFGV